MLHETERKVRIVEVTSAHQRSGTNKTYNISIEIGKDLRSKINLGEIFLILNDVGLHLVENLRSVDGFLKNR